MARFELNDSRRLTGPNLYWDRPSAIIDVDVAQESGREEHTSADVETLLGRWSVAATNLLGAVGHGGQRLNRRVFEGGLSLLISAPIDALYSMCELNEVAFALSLFEVDGGQAVDLDGEIQRLLSLFEEEAYPPVVAMQEAAARHRVPFLWDDDEVSVGYGRSAIVWPAQEVPEPQTIDWAGVGGIPVGLVTGTNGKSTTVRMAASIIRSAGLSAGLTSTDGIRVGDHILDTGDYSGPGGARSLMRHPQTEIAVLEVARGGLLRRGLGVETATTALITNVAADHLGEYGINTVEELAEAKFIVRKSLKGEAPLILNADDAQSVSRAGALEPEFLDDRASRLIWFGMDAENPVIQAHLLAGGRAAVLFDGWLELRQAGNARRVVKAADLPATFGGAARHNISNALAALALCRQLGIEDEHLRQGLLSFRGDESDNPGRANWFEKDGVRIVVDFAHNAHGMKALAHMVSRMKAARRILLMGQAGDRLDKDIAELTVAACEMAPDRLLICEMPGYERGREPGEVPALIRKVALGAGVADADIGLFPAPVEAVTDALAHARPGDMLVLLALTQRQEVLKLIHEFVGRERDCT